MEVVFQGRDSEQGYQESSAEPVLHVYGHVHMVVP